jgi:hypothetical protein
VPLFTSLDDLNTSWARLYANNDDNDSGSNKKVVPPTVTVSSIQVSLCNIIRFNTFAFVSLCMSSISFVDCWHTVDIASTVSHM